MPQLYKKPQIPEFEFAKDDLLAQLSSQPQVRNPLADILAQLVSQAGPRGFTFAGRAVKPGETLEEILSRMPIGELETASIAQMAPQSLPAAYGLSKGLASGLKSVPALIAGIPQITKTIADKIKGSVLQKPVFHGTPQAFGEFSMEKAQPGLYGKGIYFTENPEITSGYSQAAVGGKARVLPAKTKIDPATERITAKWKAPDGTDLMSVETLTSASPNVRPAFLNVKKPFDVEITYPSNVRQRLINAIDELYTHKSIPYAKDLTDEAKLFTTGELVARQIPISPDNTVHGANIMYGIKTVLGPEAVSDVIKKLGYDSITHMGGQVSGGQPHRVWIVFDPQQVVSAFSGD